MLRIQALLEQVRTGLNETVEVRIQVEGIAEIILGRQYEEISQDVETILAESTESLSLSERFLTLAEINSRLAEEIEEGFDSVVPELMGVVVLAEEVLLESGQALNSSAIATALLDEIEVRGWEGRGWEGRVRGRGREEERGVDGMGWDGRGGGWDGRGGEGRGGEGGGKGRGGEERGGRSKLCSMYSGKSSNENIISAIVEY